jgi:hypothetical protein
MPADNIRIMYNLLACTISNELELVYTVDFVSNIGCKRQTDNPINAKAMT